MTYIIEYKIKYTKPTASYGTNITNKRVKTKNASDNSLIDKCYYDHDDKKSRKVYGKED